MKRVLIVDNSRLMRSILKELLSELNLEPIGEAVDVEEGIKAYHALQPDLVTLDLIMPGGSGIDMLKEILLHDPKAKVLVITESGQTSVERQVTEMGACGILHKPVTREALQRIIKRIESTKNGNRSAGLDKPRALVVDDSLVMRSMIKDLLAELGVDTIGEATDAVEAVKAYEDCKPDLVTLDLIMPGGSGFDALRRILAQDPGAKVLLVTSVAQEKVTAEAMHLGACAVLQKPLTRDIVKNALEGVFPETRRTAKANSVKDLPTSRLGAMTPEITKSLENIFRSGSQTCIQAMDTMCKARWKLMGIRFLSGDSPEVSQIMQPSYSSKVTFVQITVNKDIPIVCLLFISRQGAEQIAGILTQNQQQRPEQDIVHLVLMEWANILIMAILSAFANIMGSALVSTPPSLVEWPAEDVLPRSIKELSDLPERSVLARVQYACEGLRAECETLFIFRADSMSKLLKLDV